MIPEYIHPEWYYKLFNEIFGWSRDYSKEISIINNSCSINNKIVEEIGAGTGNHVAEVLKYAPKEVIAIDNDSRSMDILKKRFYGVNNLFILNQDGFKRTHKADLIICMYSILQQTEFEDVLLLRVNDLINRVIVNGAQLFVEIIDTEKHLCHDSKCIYNNNGNIMYIKSLKTPYGIKLIYEGFIYGETTYYEVPLFRLPLNMLKSDKSIKSNIIPLSKSGRKMILHLLKS